MALFVITITRDFRYISGLLFLLAITYSCDSSSISSSCGGARLFVSFQTMLLHFFSPCLLRGLLGLRALFGQVGFTLALAFGSCDGFLLSFF